MAMINVLRKVIKWWHRPPEVMAVWVRWYAAYPLILRHTDELMAERGVAVDHATIHRWAVKILSVLAAVFRRRKHPVGKSWRVDETYLQVKGAWKYLYRAVDRDGQTVHLLLTAKRDLAAAQRLFERAIDQHGLPESITIDKSGANTTAVRSLIADIGAEILLRQNRYLNNLVEQDHRAVKRITRPMMGFKSFRCARATIAGIKTMHMIRKGQKACPGGILHACGPAVSQSGFLIGGARCTMPRAQHVIATEPYSPDLRSGVAAHVDEPRHPQRFQGLPRQAAHTG